MPGAELDVIDTAPTRSDPTMLRAISLLSLLLFAAACTASDTGTGQGQSGSGAADGEGDGGEDDGQDGDDGGEDDGEHGDDGDGHGDRDDCKIEGEDIGRDVVVELGSVSVTFGDWVAKEDSPGEYVGFTMAVEGADGIAYRVKAGGEVFDDTALTWIHPAGTSGPEASGISNVDMCDDEDDDGGDHGDDGGDAGDGGDDHGDDSGDAGDDHGDDGGDGEDGGDVDVG
jgi:hypothetical protein